MCRNIKTLFNFAPPATDLEVRAASIQFVRKLSGYTAPSKANEKAFERAISKTFKAARELIDSLETMAEPKDREQEAAKAKERNVIRFGPSAGRASAARSGAPSGRGRADDRLGLGPSSGRASKPKTRSAARS